MEIPRVVEDILKEVGCYRYGLALIPWPKLTIVSYGTAGLGTAIMLSLVQQAPQRWGASFLGSALVTVSIALLMRHGVIAARSKADGRRLSGLGEVRRSIRDARVRDVRRLLEERDYRTRKAVKKLLELVVSRLNEKPTGGSQLPTPVVGLLPVVLGVLLTTLVAVMGARSVSLVATVLLVGGLVACNVWLTVLKPLLESDRRRLLDARHLLEEVLIDMKRTPPAPPLIESSVPLFDRPIARGDLTGQASAPQRFRN